MTLALVRVSGMVAFAPFFSSTALPMRAKAVFVGAVAFLLAPLVAALPAARRRRSASRRLLGELAVGLVYGLSLTLLNEMLLFAGQIAGLQFSFSLVNLLDPASAIQTPLLGDLFQLMGTLVVITAGLDRILLASMVRSFRAVPLGSLRARAPGRAGHRARGRRHLSGRGGTGRAGPGRHHAGRGRRGAAGQAQPAAAGDVADRAAEDPGRLCDPDRLSGALAALYRGALRRPARHGRAPDRRSPARSPGWEANRCPASAQNRHPAPARKGAQEGDILHSRELSAAAGTLAGVMALGVLGSRPWRPGAALSRPFSLWAPAALGAVHAGADAGRHAPARRLTFSGPRPS